ncbi:MAG: hypothetical protein RBR71_06505 [Gudongella sp.]|nr:hypothetical protein [Gudongella sp.]
MITFIEIVGSLIYLALILYMGFYIDRNNKGESDHAFFGLMTMVLAISESAYIIPRSYAILTTGVENNLKLLGWAKLVQFIGLSLFFIMFIHLYRLRFNIKRSPSVNKLLYGIMLFRIVIGVLPQNNWFDITFDRTFLIVRTVILALYIFALSTTIYMHSIKPHNRSLLPIIAVLIPLFAFIEPQFLNPVNIWLNFFIVILRGLILLGIVAFYYKEVRKEDELSRF